MVILTRATLSVRPDREHPSPDYIHHQLVADLFAEQRNRSYLFRVQRDRPGGVEVYVHSDTMPQPLDRVPVRPFGAAVHHESRKIEVRVMAGQVFDLAIRVNLVRSRARSNTRTDVWDALRDEEPGTTAEAAYGPALSHRLRGMAALHGVQYMGRRRISIPRRASPPIQFIAADLLARVEIINPDQVEQLLLRGVGRSRAFGCGMPMLAPAGQLLTRVGTDRLAAAR
jgi:CRISPR system Cascade subunit CasE